MRRDGAVLAAVAASFFFASATTFQSLGVVLFAMQGDFHWSETATGSAFLALGLMCCASGLLPVALIPRIGGRWTVCCGCLILALGFAFASLTQSLPMIYFAAGLFGVGFPLAASTPGIYLIAAWFGKRASRMIGLYLMVGTLGGALGPPLAEALIASAGGWRLYWLAMAAAGLVTAALCAALIKEPPSAVAGPANPADAAAADAGWSYGEALRTPQFLVLALALVATQTGLVTVSSVASPHFYRLGWPGGAAAEILGAQALVGTVATGISGWLTERVDPRRLHAVALLAQAVGMLLLAFATTGWLTYAFILSFGIGWSVARVAITILLIRYFGHKSGTAVMSTIWMLCGVAALGPPAAGLVADLTGSFTPALSALGLLLLPLAAAASLMRSPRRKRLDRIAPQYP